MEDTTAEEKLDVTLYALHHCNHCKKAKAHLADRDVNLKTIYMDMLTGSERNDTLRHLRRINPAVSFPTIVIAGEVIVGFKPADIDITLNRHHRHSG